MKSFGAKRMHCFLAVWASLYASVVQECSGFIQHQQQRLPIMRSFLGGATPAGVMQQLHASKNRGSMDMEQTQKAKTLYDILDAPPTATRQELKSHYVKLAKLSHPDALISKEGAAMMSVVEDIPDFAEVSAAWRVLGDSKTRQRYDRELKAKRIAEVAQKFANDRLEEAIPAMAAMMDRFVDPFAADDVAPNSSRDEHYQQEKQPQYYQREKIEAYSYELGWLGPMALKMEDILGGSEQKQQMAGEPEYKPYHESEDWIQFMTNRMADVLSGVREQALYTDYELVEPMMTRRTSISADGSSAGTIAFSTTDESHSWNRLMTGLVKHSARVLSNLVDVVAITVKDVLLPRMDD